MLKEKNERLETEMKHAKKEVTDQLEKVKEKLKSKERECCDL